MAEFESNSYKSKENPPEKKVEKVVTGGVKQKKKSEVTKLADIIMAEDIHNVLDYVKNDIIIPTVKKTLYEIIKNGSDMLIFGRSGQRRDDIPGTRVQYTRYYNDERDRDRRMSNRSRSYEDYEISNSRDAEEVLKRMKEMINQYGSVSVGEYYDLLGIVGDFTDFDYGWMNLNNAYVARTRDGYTIKLPRAVSLK